MISLLQTRRSIRKFTEQAIESEKIQVLKEAVLRAPTSKNSNACEYIFVENPELIEKLAQCKPQGASPLQTAQLAIAVLVNDSKTVAWIEDGSIASIIAHLTAHSLGLGSCWIQVRGREFSDEKSSEEYVRECLNIPVEYRVLSIVAIGHAAKPQPGKLYDKLDFSKIRTNTF
jgi:nitroreductase